jgi:hypothetical protein
MPSWTSGAPGPGPADPMAAPSRHDLRRRATGSPVPAVRVPAVRVPGGRTAGLTVGPGPAGSGTGGETPHRPAILPRCAR